ncbi:dihydrofolate reductase family protein [Bacteroidota bacterium]
MPNIVYIATSLDGYIARKDGTIDWLMDIPNPEKSDYGFNEFMDRVDGVLMGRNTFETVVSFGEWPYTKPVFVLSTTLTRLPDAYQEKAFIVKGDLSRILESLKEEGIENIYIDGGKTIQSFLQEDLIDELIITRIPLVLGTGIPLFNETDQEFRFKTSETEVLNDYLVKTTYLRYREN